MGTRFKIFKEIGGQLKRGREARGLTQLELAHRLGYRSSQFVSNWERGLVAPPLKNIQKILDILLLSPRGFRSLYIELFTWEVENVFPESRPERNRKKSSRSASSIPSKSVDSSSKRP